MMQRSISVAALLVSMTSAVTSSVRKPTAAPNPAPTPIDLLETRSWVNWEPATDDEARFNNQNLVAAALFCIFILPMIVCIPVFCCGPKDGYLVGGCGNGGKRGVSVVSAAKKAKAGAEGGVKGGGGAKSGTMGAPKTAPKAAPKAPSVVAGKAAPVVASKAALVVAAVADPKDVTLAQFLDARGLSKYLEAILKLGILTAAEAVDKEYLPEEDLINEIKMTPAHIAALYSPPTRATDLDDEEDERKSDDDDPLSKAYEKEVRVATFEGSLGMGVQFREGLGAVVASVASGKAAELLGVALGSVIVTVNGEALPRGVTDKDFAQRLAAAGNPVALGLRLPKGVCAAIFVAGPLGLGVMFQPGVGVVVGSVKPGTQAEALGLAPGCRIAKLGPHEVPSSMDDRAFGGLLQGLGRPFTVIFERAEKVKEDALKKKAEEADDDDNDDVDFAGDESDEDDKDPAALVEEGRGAGVRSGADRGGAAVGTAVATAGEKTAEGQTVAHYLAARGLSKYADDFVEMGIQNAAEIVDKELLPTEDLVNDLGMTPAEVAALYGPPASATSATGAAAAAALVSSSRTAQAVRAFMVSRGQQESRLDDLAARGLTSVASLTDPAACSDAVLAAIGLSLVQARVFRRASAALKDAASSGELKAFDPSPADAAPFDPAAGSAPAAPLAAASSATSSAGAEAEGSGVEMTATAVAAAADSGGAKARREAAKAAAKAAVAAAKAASAPAASSAAPAASAGSATAAAVSAVLPAAVGGAVGSQAVAPCCLNGHALKDFKTKFDGYSCSHCAKAFDAKTVLSGCRACDYDLCSPCAAARFPQPAVAPAPVDMATAASAASAAGPISAMVGAAGLPPRAGHKAVVLPAGPLGLTLMLGDATEGFLRVGSVAGGGACASLGVAAGDLLLALAGVTVPKGTDHAAAGRLLAALPRPVHATFLAASSLPATTPEAEANYAFLSSLGLGRLADDSTMQLLEESELVDPSVLTDEVLAGDFGCTPVEVKAFRAAAAKHPGRLAALAALAASNQVAFANQSASATAAPAAAPAAAPSAPGLAPSAVSSAASPAPTQLTDDPATGPLTLKGISGSAAQLMTIKDISGSAAQPMTIKGISGSAAQLMTTKHISGSAAQPMTIKGISGSAAQLMTTKDISGSAAQPMTIKGISGATSASRGGVSRGRGAPSLPKVSPARVPAPGTAVAAKAATGATATPVVSLDDEDSGSEEEAGHLELATAMAEGGTTSAAEKNGADSGSDELDLAGDSDTESEDGDGGVDPRLQAAYGVRKGPSSPSKLKGPSSVALPPVVPAAMSALERKAAERRRASLSILGVGKLRPQGAQRRPSTLAPGGGGGDPSAAAASGSSAGPGISGGARRPSVAGTGGAGSAALNARRGSSAGGFAYAGAKGPVGWLTSAVGLSDGRSTVLAAKLAVRGLATVEQLEDRVAELDDQALHRFVKDDLELMRDEARSFRKALGRPAPS